MRSRTPRNYRGTQNPAKQVSDLLPEVMLKLSKKGYVSKEDILPFWRELLGEKMADMTEIVSFQEKTLTVKVKSSTLYSLLGAHEKPRLLAALQKKFSIQKLNFRVG
jgi:hypothetical protein